MWKSMKLMWNGQLRDKATKERGEVNAAFDD